MKDCIDQNPSECSDLILDPSALVARHISHKFELDDTCKIQWYHGTIVGYDAATKNTKSRMMERENIAILT